MMQFVRTAILAAGVAVIGVSASAQDLSATMRVSGDMRGTFAVESNRNTIMADTQGRYFSVEVFAEGVDAGRAACGTADFYEVDFFFGQETSFGGHVLFSLQRTNTGFVATNASLLFDRFDSRGNAVETYADFDNSQVVLTRLGCLPNGQVDMAIQFKGRGLSDEGFGAAQLQMAGTADGAAILKDMNDY